MTERIRQVHVMSDGTYGRARVQDSRKVVGWAFGERMNSDLVMARLNMALRRRRPSSVIHRSDQGSPIRQLGVWQMVRANGGQTVNRHGGRRL